MARAGLCDSTFLEEQFPCMPLEGRPVVGFDYSRKAKQTEHLVHYGYHCLGGGAPYDLDHRVSAKFVNHDQQVLAGGYWSIEVDADI